MTLLSLYRATEEEFGPAPDRPTHYRCPSCAREYDESTWQCLTWLQFAGTVRSGRLIVTVEVRRCVCSEPIGRERLLPMVEVIT